MGETSCSEVRDEAMQGETRGPTRPAPILCTEGAAEHAEGVFRPYMKILSPLHGEERNEASSQLRREGK